MQENLYLEVVDLCKNNGIEFMFRHDVKSDIYHFKFYKGDKVIDFSMNYYIMLFQPTWITIRDIKDSIKKLCDSAAQDLHSLL